MEVDSLFNARDPEGDKKVKSVAQLVAVRHETPELLQRNEVSRFYDHKDRYLES